MGRGVRERTEGKNGAKLPWFNAGIEKEEHNRKEAQENSEMKEVPALAVPKVPVLRLGIEALVHSSDRLGSDGVDKLLDIV